MTHSQRTLAVGLLLAAAAIVGCSRAHESAPPAVMSEDSVAVGAAAPVTASTSSPATKAAATNRKIVRQAELTLQVGSPGATQTALEKLAERRGGYVVSAARDTDTGSEVNVHITVTVRVPQAELTDAIAELKHYGHGVGSERITSDDVTDEFVDLSARMASQRQLEAQYLEILKRAVTVKDAMEVQKELAVVRTEIERMQGRQQLLEKESAFSTLTVHLVSAVPQLAVTPRTFGNTLRRTWAEGLSFSAELISGGLMLLGVLVPVLILLVLPSVLGFLGLRKVLRVLAKRRQRFAEPAAP